MCRSSAAPKDVDAVVVTITKKRTIQFVDWFLVELKCGFSCQGLMVAPGGDLERCRPRAGSATPVPVCNNGEN